MYFLFMPVFITFLSALCSYLIIMSVSAVKLTFVPLWWLLHFCVSNCESVLHSAALKEEKPFNRTKISSLQGVPDSFGLDWSKCLGLHKDSWLQNDTSDTQSRKTGSLPRVHVDLSYSGRGSVMTSCSFFFQPLILSTLCILVSPGRINVYKCIYACWLVV